MGIIGNKYNIYKFVIFIYMAKSQKTALFLLGIVLVVITLSVLFGTAVLEYYDNMTDVNSNSNTAPVNINTKIVPIDTYSIILSIGNNQLSQYKDANAVKNTLLKWKTISTMFDASYNCTKIKQLFDAQQQKLFSFYNTNMQSFSGDFLYYLKSMNINSLGPLFKYNASLLTDNDINTISTNIKITNNNNNKLSNDNLNYLLKYIVPTSYNKTNIFDILTQQQNFIINLYNLSVKLSNNLNKLTINSNEYNTILSIKNNIISFINLFTFHIEIENNLEKLFLSQNLSAYKFTADVNKITIEISKNCFSNLLK